MNTRLILYGSIGWLAATATLRFLGQGILHPGNVTATLLLFAASFALMAWLTRWLCRRLELPSEQWSGAAISLFLPTLLLDPFSSAFFPAVFPNIAPEAAGTFGGWMIISCAGALVGAIARR
jgi:hypothetical protein